MISVVSVNIFENKRDQLNTVVSQRNERLTFAYCSNLRNFGFRIEGENSESDEIPAFFRILTVLKHTPEL